MVCCERVVCFLSAPNPHASTSGAIVMSKAPVVSVLSAMAFWQISVSISEDSIGVRVCSLLNMLTSLSGLNMDNVWLRVSSSVLIACLSC